MIRNNKSVVFNLTRKKIKIKSVQFALIDSNKYVYVRITTFENNTSNELTEVLKSIYLRFPGVQGLVLDLRDNPGGLLQSAVGVLSIFLPPDSFVLYMKDRYNNIFNFYTHPTWYNIDGTQEKEMKSLPVGVKSLPMVVLINQNSASASEIVSGSLQDLDRAVIIGQRTFGKGLVQTTRPLSYNSQIKITTSKYYIPSGRCIQALDYTHRNEDGSVGKIPDSLVSEFKTSAGRKVYDGGGINPDYSTPIKKLNPICNSLVNKSIIFDFASRYRTLHDSIPQGNFELTDADWIEFLKYIADKEYDYITKSEKSLEEFKKNSEDELYFETLKSDIETLQSKLNHNKQEDIDKNKTDIVALLEDEIASRYGYQQGRIRESLTHDKEIMKAIDILNDKATYTGILSGAINANAGEKNEGVKIKN